MKAVSIRALAVVATTLLARHADDQGDLPSARHGRSLMKCAPIPKGRGVE